MVVLTSCNLASISPTPRGLNSARAAAACRSVRDAAWQVSLRLHRCQSVVARRGGREQLSDCEAWQAACAATCSLQVKPPPPPLQRRGTRRHPGSAAASNRFPRIIGTENVLKRTKNSRPWFSKTFQIRVSCDVRLQVLAETLTRAPHKSPSSSAAHRLAVRL